MAANLLFLLASRLGLLSVVGVLLALYPASTVLLALLVLKERLHRVQLVGLAVASGGVVLIALG
jgi:drug/metabolite transporter (DMT)-like permease